MVYKKYIKRGNKIHGPYYYESYRDENGETKSRYLKNYKEKSNKKIFLFIFLTILVVTGFIFSLYLGADDNFPKFANMVSDITSPLLKITGFVSFNPSDKRTIGYEYLNLSGDVVPYVDAEVVHMWNTQDDYFFNKSSGIQFSNHFEEYWAKNIFCIGYYNETEWIKIKCADELDNFERSIHSDNQTYVNATLWKDITYGGYDLRLGINYYLELNDKNLTITIYGKNIGIDIPFDLGFAWRLTDIQIDNSYENDYLHIWNNDSVQIISLGNNDTHFNYTNLDITKFEMVDSNYYLRLNWNESLPYKLMVDSNEYQYNAPTTLLINAGHFNPQQEKSTTMYWIDAITNSTYSGIAGHLLTETSWMHNIPCGDDMVLLVGLAVDSEVGPVANWVTYNGTNLTVLTTVSTVKEIAMDVWNLTSPSCGDDYDVVVDYRLSTTEEVVGISVAYYGVDYIDNSTLDTFVSEEETNTLLGITTSSEDEIVVDMVAIDTVDTIVINGGDNQTRIGSYSEGAVLIASSYAFDGDGTTNIGWYWDGDEVVHAAVALIPMLAPDQPTLNYPANGSTTIELSPVLNITVTDINNDIMNVTFWNEIKSITARGHHSCGILENGSMMCWGINSDGQIGIGTDSGPDDCSGWACSINPVLVNSTESFVSISAGFYHTCGILENGSAMCWGDNRYAQLGNGSDGGKALNPVFVNTTESFVSIIAGEHHTCGLLGNGSAMCWGRSLYGQIGNGSLGDDVVNPVFVNTTESFVSITRGMNHNCGLLGNGSMMCWGDNSDGQIGNGSYENALNPVFVNTTESFVSITGGFAHTCGVLSNGSMMCWGRNDYGEIGNGSSGFDILNPVFVNSTESFVSTAAGNSYTCGVLENRSMMCWGGNGYGQIGNGSYGHALNPVFVNSTESFVSTATGQSHTCGLLGNGSMMCWGWNYFGQIGNGSSGFNILNPVFVNTTETMESPVIGDATNIANGSYATTTWSDLDEDITYLWRTTVFDGDLITNSPIWKFTTVTYGWLDVSISKPDDNSEFWQGDVNLTINATVTCQGGANAKCGTVYALARYGSSSPDTAINTTEGASPFYIMAGANPKSNSSLNESQSFNVSWTLNVTSSSIENYLIDVLFNSSYGSTNIPENDTEDRLVKLNLVAPNQPTLNYPANGSTGIEFSPVLNITVTDPNNDAMNVTFWNQIESITGGGTHTCSLLDNRSLMCWGRNDYGQIGIGSSGADELNPVFVNSTKLFVSISAGRYYTCSVLSNGTAMCWGRNDFGQIGDGTNGTDRLNPVFVNSTESFVSITTGQDHTCGLLSNRSAMCWGDNLDGEIGNGSSGGKVLNPVFVNSTESFVSITVGIKHTCGLLTKGSIMCWGNNDFGQIGNGDSDTDILNPVFVNSTESFVSITTGFFHTCGLLSNRSAMCWGQNYFGQIGNGDSGTEDILNPTFINSTESFISITAKSYHTCGLLSNGSVMCWGYNSDGQIGNGDNDTNVLNPTFINSTESFISIDAGYSHTCSVLNNGSAMCWGKNDYGQIGNGDSGADVLNPVFVNTTETMEHRSLIIGNATNIASGSAATTTWAGLDTNRTYLWSATVSDGDSIANSPIWKFTTFTYGWLNVSISKPDDNSEWVTGDTNLTINTIVTCEGGTNAKCGTVSALARYNTSTGSPDTAINKTEGGLPFYIFNKDWSKTLDETVFNPDSTAQTPMTTVDNDSVAIVYDDDGKGKFVVYNINGTVELDETVFNPTTIFFPSVTTIDNDSIAIAYIDFSFGLNGTLVVYNINGTVELNKTVFNPANTWYPGVTTIDNDSVAIAYNDGGAGNNGTFVVYNINGTVELGKTVFNPADTRELSITTIDNDSVAIAYQDYDAGSNGTFVVYNINGTVELNETVFNPPSTSDVSITTIDNDSVAIAWRNGAGVNGTFIVYNINGTVELNETMFNPSDSHYISITTIDNDSIAISYADDVAGGLDGTFVVYNINGTVELNETVFELNEGLGIDYTSITTINNDSIAIAYANQDTGSNGTFVVYSLVAKNPKISSEVLGEPLLETLEQGESWNVIWTLNVTSTSESSYLLDVLFNSSYGDASVPDNHTEDRTVIISVAADETPPNVYLESPSNNTQNTTNSTPDFTFNATDEAAATLDCTLWLDNGTEIAYGNNATTLNATSTTITANASLANDDYWWWMNCSDGSNTNISEKRNISIQIDTIPPNINFTSPTPDNGSNQSEDFVYVNVTTNDTNNHSAWIDWNYSLVGWWNFENVLSNGIVYDNSTWGNDGILYDHSTNTTVSGKRGKALEFDGDNDYINAGNDNSLNITGNITVGAWVKPVSLAGVYNTITEKNWNLAGASWILGINVVDDFEFYVKTSGGLATASKITPTLGNWYYVVGTYDGADVYIYINGNLEDSTPLTGTIGSNNANVYIGRRGNNENEYFNGTIDEVMIWNRALSPEEINASYNAGLYRLYNNFTNLSAGTYNYTAYAIDVAGNTNQTEQRTITITADNEYPQFSNYWDDNASLVGNGTGNFNVTVTSTNGTVWLEIDGNNVTATNLTADVYNASHYFSSSGVYSYRWHSWGNGTSANYNVSSERSYTLNTSDTTPPNINFTSPTPDNGSSTSNTSIEINVSITNASDLSQVIYNWNSTNYTMYNDSLVLMFNFDNVSALGENDTHVIDLSGNGNNGTIIGATVNESGRFGKSINISSPGSGDTINVTNGDALNLNGNEMTFSIWLNPSTDPPSNRFIMDKTQGNTQGFRVFYVGVNNYVRYRMETTSGFVNCDTEFNGALSDYGNPAGVWHHLAGTYDGVDMKVYYDGKFVVNASNCAQTGTITQTTTNLYIGSDDALTTNLEARVDEVRIWNRSLTADEIAILYMSNLNKYDTDKWALYVNQSKNSTAGLDVGNYTYQAFASDTSSNWNQTEERTITIEAADNEYPQFSTYWDDNASLVGNGTGNFNVTVTSTNGTVWLEINNTNITATNLTANMYNASHYFSTNGTYAYRWHSWGNGTSENYNVSSERSYTVNTSDTTPPNINFTLPTPDNGSSTSNTSIEINVSITNASDLKQVIYNWNSTNYTIYNDSLVLMMNFDNVSALGENDTHVVDLSKYGNNGTGEGGVAVNTTDCKFGNCFTFDKVDDYVNIGNDSSLNDLKNVTYEAWIYPFSEGEGGNGVLFFRRPGSAFYFGGNNAFVFSIAYSGTDVLKGTIDDAITLNEWNHLTATWDGSNLSSGIKIYVNGIETSYQAEVNATGTYDSDSAVTKKIGNNAPLSFTFDGNIDEVRIWNRSLSAAEIQQLYFSNLNKYDPANWTLYVNQSKNATAGLDYGNYTYQAFASDTNNNWNQTEERTITIEAADNEYPQFSNYWDDNASLVGNGTGNFNVTVTSTNGTVLLEINGTNITATNLTANMYNASHYFSTNGTYAYRWHSWGNGTQENYNVSIDRNYTVNESVDNTPPNINFTLPTPDNGSSTSNTSIEINVSIANASDLNQVIYNWNSTNYTIYNDSLVLMMNFDNVSSLGENDTYVVDLSGYGNNMTCSGASCPTLNTTETKFGNAFIFDGGDYFEINDSNQTGLDLQDLTFSAWVYATSLPTGNWETDYIFTKWNTADDNRKQYSINILKWGVDPFTISFRCNFRNASGTNPAVTEPNDGEDRVANTWYHVTCTYDNDAGTYEIYVNAIIEKNSTGYITFPDTDAAFRIGAAENNVNYWNGLIDEVRIWNRSLNADEVYQQYVSNLNKYNQTQWYLYVNQSKNSTAGLDAGNYTYQAFASDTSSNWNQTEERVVTITTADTTPPNVYLESPSNNTLNTTNSTPDFTFNTTDETATTLDCTLWLDNGTAEQYGNNDSVLNATSTTIAANASLANDNYWWWVNCSDGPNTNISEKRNISIQIDTTPPTVNLVAPENNSEWNSSSTVIFTYNVSDTNSIENCSLIINGSINQTNSSITKDTNQTFNQTLSDGNYNWSINCTDSFNNIGASGTYNLTVNVSVSYSIDLSAKLGQQINWTLSSLPAYNQSAEGNNNTEITEYYVNISAEGTTVDLYVKANDDLKTPGLDILGLGNETYSYNITNSSVPSENKSSLTINYADNPIGEDLGEGAVVYLKFFLNAPSGQPAGTYNNSLLFKAVPNGQSP